jgi:hypothetical protein
MTCAPSWTARQLAAPRASRAITPAPGDRSDDNQDREMES